MSAWLRIPGMGTWHFENPEMTLAIKRAMTDPVSHEFPADATDEDLRDACWWLRPPDEEPKP